MKRCISSSRRVSIAVLATAIVTLSGSVFAQSVDQVLQAELRRLNLAQQSQERINNIVEGTRSLEDQYRAINKEIDGLRVYNRLMMAQTEGQKAVLEDISLSMDQVDVINRQIFPLMERMIDGLEQSVALDVPFLMEERSARIDNLKEIMERSDVSVAEKFRKVMEAFQIEMDFGSTIEPYTSNPTSNH
jgi:methyl-accepting chemotaxis protein